MNLDVIQQLIAPASGLLIAAAQALTSHSKKDVRAQIMDDIAICKSLHEQSTTKSALEEHIDRQVRLVIAQGRARRDPLGIGIAVVFFVLAGTTAVPIIQLGGLWWILSPIVGFFIIFAIFGLAQDGVKRERDNKGTPLRAQSQ